MQMFLFYYYKTTSSMLGNSNSNTEQRMNKFQFNSKFNSNVNSNSNPIVELVNSLSNYSKLHFCHHNNVEKIFNEKDALIEVACHIKWLL